MQLKMATGGRSQKNEREPQIGGGDLRLKRK
jgi:hypothetical protein